MLRFSDAITVWARVYFYGIIVVLVSMGVFAFTPVKRWLTQSLEARSKRILAGTTTPAAPSAEARPATSEKETDKKAKKITKKVKDEVEKEEADEDEEGQKPLALGVPDDLAGDIDEARREIQREIEMRRRRGSAAAMPSGQELKAAIEDRIGRKF